jgi:hypothetical protein
MMRRIWSPSSGGRRRNFGVEKGGHFGWDIQAIVWDRVNTLLRLIGYEAVEVAGWSRRRVGKSRSTNKAVQDDGGKRVVSRAFLNSWRALTTQYWRHT